MNLPVWIALVTAYPFLLALILSFFQGVGRANDQEPAPQLAPEPAAPRRPTMKIEAFGREVARFEILEHVAPDGELLEFHVPPPETPSDWTVDQVADLLAAIDALSQAPDRETL